MDLARELRGREPLIVVVAAPGTGLTHAPRAWADAAGRRYLAAGRPSRAGYLHAWDWARRYDA